MIQDLTEGEIDALKRVFRQKAFKVFEKMVEEEVQEGLQGIAQAELVTDESIRRQIRRQGELKGMQAVLGMIQEVRDHGREE